MNFVRGSAYKTVNGGSVRIIDHYRSAMDDQHWFGFYDTDDGGSILYFYFDSNGTAYDIFKRDTAIDPGFSIIPEPRRSWLGNLRRRVGAEFDAVWHYLFEKLLPEEEVYRHHVIVRIWYLIIIIFFIFMIILPFITRAGS